MSQKVALVTSGLGTKYGGIGVVANSIKGALDPFCEVVVWQHPPFWPRLLRISKIAAHVFLGSLRSLDLVIYDHLHLAVLHSMFPTLRKVPYAVFLHGVEAWEPLSSDRCDALLAADLLIANSATTIASARAANPWLPQAEPVWLGVSVLPQPVDVGLLPPVGLIVGRMSGPERCKGHDAVLDAWPHIRAAVPDAKLVIVGEGRDKFRLRQRVGNEGLHGIEFRGFLSDSERDCAYRSARMLFYPSSKEGFGLAGVEALAFGVPFVGLAGTVVEELFPHGEGVVLAKNITGGGVAEAAIPLLKDAQLASELGRLGRSRVQTTFLESHFAARFRRALGPFLPSLDVQGVQHASRA